MTPSCVWPCVVPRCRQNGCLTRLRAGKLPKNKAGDRVLLYWAFEDALKRRFSGFLASLASCLSDNIDFVREKALKCAYELLAAKPEAEARLLSMLINKLGDPGEDGQAVVFAYADSPPLAVLAVLPRARIPCGDPSHALAVRKVASRAVYYLQCLLTEHPGMKMVVAKETERLLFRPNLHDRARYYAVVFLSQMVLDRRKEGEGSELALKLMDTYFTLFRLVVEGKIGHAAEAAAQKVERAKKGDAKGKRARQEIKAKEGRDKSQVREGKRGEG